MEKIIIFTSSTWPHCHTAKDLLQREGILFEEKNVQKDKEAQLEMRENKLMGVPAFKINGEYFVGLDMNRILKSIDYSVDNCPNCGKKNRIPKGKGKIKIKCGHCGENFIKNT